MTFHYRDVDLWPFITGTSIYDLSLPRRQSMTFHYRDVDLWPFITGTYVFSFEVLTCMVGYSVVVWWFSLYHMVQWL